MSVNQNAVSQSQDATFTPAVELVDIAKSYGTVQALRPTSLSIASGDYFVLLGPSGGGKTTTLRLIGGLIKPTAGKVIINGVDVSQLPPNRRDTSMVFQSYALFPHMNVEQNVGYGLSLRRIDSGLLKDKVNSMLEMVGLADYNARMPHQLSGGQQQRVQLARSLVLDSSILLLDEPLAALDEKLRKAMCIELKRIQDRVGITFIHVTHNQEEAMTVADEIAVMAQGDLVESGPVRQIYEKPRRRFTADFIGESTVFEGQVRSIDGERVSVDLGFDVIDVLADDVQVAVGQQVAVSLRSELAQVTADHGAHGSDHQSVQVRFIEEVYLGFATHSLVKLPNDQDAYARSTSAQQADALNPGDSARLVWQTSLARLHVD